MKIAKKSPRKKITLLLISAVILIGLAALAWYLLNPAKNNDSNSPEFTENSTRSNSDNGENIKSTQPETENNRQTPPISDEVPVSSTGTVTIDSLSQQSGYINARAVTSNFAATKCVYQFVSDGARPVVREVTGDCTGISINQNEFEKIGTYTLTVTVYGSDNNKITTTKSINVT